MTIDGRDRRSTAAGREGAARTPRSGGRTAEQRTTPERIRRTPVSRTPGRGASAVSGGARVERRFATQGATALQVPAADPATVVTAKAPRLRVAPPAPISVPRAPFVALVVGLVVVGVFGILLINTKTNENTFQIFQLQTQQAALNNQQQELERQIAEFENAGNLDARARTQGLVKPDAVAYIRLPDGKVFGESKSGTGRTSVTAQDTDPTPATGSTATGSGSTAGGSTAGGSTAGGTAQVAGR